MQRVKLSSAESKMQEAWAQIKSDQGALSLPNPKLPKVRDSFVLTSQTEGPC